MDDWIQPIPQLGVLGYIWEWMCEIGIGEPITWAEIKAWSDLTGIAPNRDEAVLITRLSKIWINEKYRGSQKGVPAPEEYYEWLQSQN